MAPRESIVIQGKTKARQNATEDKQVVCNKEDTDV
jgi:hypothetical protein